MTGLSLIKGEVNYIFIYTKQQGCFLPKQIFRNQLYKGSHTVPSLCCLIFRSDFRAAESKAVLKQREMSHDMWRSKDGWHSPIPQTPFFGDLPQKCSFAWGQLFLWISSLGSLWLRADCVGLLGVGSDPLRCLKESRMSTSRHPRWLKEDPWHRRPMPSSKQRLSGKPQGISNSTRRPCVGNRIKTLVSLGNTYLGTPKSNL